MGRARAGARNTSKRLPDGSGPFIRRASQHFIAPIGLRNRIFETATDRVPPKMGLFRPSLELVTSAKCAIFDGQME